MAEGRKSIDCREHKSVNNCSLYMSGTEAEVLALAKKHAIEAHGHEDTPELAAMLKSGMKDEAVAV
ncbi:MAG TPA: DUF1059 domain-containing protein [Candidatus Baltobacteraceae bacterium]|nr:DUF1059 domain-containing protein [Candidatus Baltobacteraceae bacterium]